MSGRHFRLDGYDDEVESEFLVRSLVRSGWIRTTGDDWDLFWSAELPARRVLRELVPGKRVNHFQGVATLHFKDELHHYLSSAAGRVGAGGGWYDFFPRTFAMPADHGRWRAAAAAEPETIWIQKPKRLAEGRDIAIVADPDAVENDAKWIVQEYLADPLLLPGRPYKHILRLYVLITSLDPLVAFLYRNGPVKFTSRPFGTSPDELTDPVIHLTNPRVQRTNQDVPDPVRALDLPAYRAELVSAGFDDAALWRRIRSILTQTLIAHREPMLRVSGYVCERLDCCFELLGFDVLVDARLRPWVVECNMSPALGVRGAEGSPHREAQRRAKESMVADTLAVVGVGEDEFEIGYGPDRFAAEMARRGEYEVLFPGRDAADFVRCFERLSAADVSLIEAAAVAVRT